VAALVLVAVGAGAAYFGLRSSGSSLLALDERTGLADPPRTIASPAADPAGEPPASPDVIVTLSPEAIARAGITVTSVTAGTASGAFRVPGVIEPNAYKQVVVTPLVSGRVTQVGVELGQHVQRGQALAQIFSPELVEAQARYISARADLEAHEQELARTEKLASIGAASRQELERIHAGHTARRAGVESAASRLQLLGLSDDVIAGLGPGTNQSATTNVPAPIGGVVTERVANVGLNVEQATTLFTIVDLSSVWVVANVYEKDFGRVRVGTTAAVTISAYPDVVLQGRVSYIDPRVNSDTRTARIRIEVPNAGGELRLGMYAEALVGGEDGASMPMIPRSAVQNVGERTVVYLVNPNAPGQFVEREVHLGIVAGDRVSVTSGVQPGDALVGEGSFSIRAERERLGLRTPAGVQATASQPAVGEQSARHDDSNVQEAKVIVTDASFDPQKVVLRAGVPARLTFTRTSDRTCATAIVFASLSIRRDLPLNQPVTIEFTPDKAGQIAFACGMNMLRGVVVVQ